MCNTNNDIMSAYSQILTAKQILTSKNIESFKDSLNECNQYHSIFFYEGELDFERLASIMNSRIPCSVLLETSYGQMKLLYTNHSEKAIHDIIAQLKSR